VFDITRYKGYDISGNKNEWVGWPWKTSDRKVDRPYLKLPTKAKLLRLIDFVEAHPEIETLDDWNRLLQEYACQIQKLNP
jgi:hypothetical protein